MTSPVPDALRTQLAEVLAEKKRGYLRTVDGRVWVYLADPAGIADALMPVVETALARARAEGAAEALRAAEEFARRRESELYQDYRAPHLSALTRRRIEGEQHGWGHAADNLAYRAALSAPTTTEGDPT